MCGIVGLINPQNRPLQEITPLKTAHIDDLAQGMLGLIEHRGPDEMGILKAKNNFFANARLKIVDLTSGIQPISSSSGRYWIVYNGEIYDVANLRSKLIAKGYHFKTQTDTEVIVNLFEEYGTQLTDFLNGEFAFAIYDSQTNESFLFRDPMGIKPLFYAPLSPHGILFSSEIKPILWAQGLKKPRLNSGAIRQSLECWAPLPPATSFESVFQIKPGSYLKIGPQGLHHQRYWTFSPSAQNSTPNNLEEIHELLENAVKRRLVADVPVGVYLSGGLDSSIVAHLATQNSDHPIHSFSVEFKNPLFDESSAQKVIQRHIGSRHHALQISEIDILDSFIPTVITAESSLFRSASVPMYLLSKLAQSQNIKVVLTGEGSDELFSGYDIYKEYCILKKWAKSPHENHFEDILKIYSYLPQFKGMKAKMMLPFYKQLLSSHDQRFFGHLSRWSQVQQHNLLLKPNPESVPLAHFIDTHYPEIQSLNQEDELRAVECLTLLHGYLLSSQGDRMASAHSVEARIPFLDRDVMNYAFHRPLHAFFDGLQEKAPLFKSFKKTLPQEIIQKKKQPFLSLDCEIFFKNNWPIEDFVNHNSLQNTEVFQTTSTLDFFGRLKEIVGKGVLPSRRENTAFFVVLSTMILWEQMASSLNPKPINPNIPLRKITIG